MTTPPKKDWSHQTISSRVLTPPNPCKCGGYYQACEEVKTKEAFIVHSQPYCDAFAKVTTVGEATNYMQHQREWFDAQPKGALQ